MEERNKLEIDSNSIEMIDTTTVAMQTDRVSDGQCWYWQSAFFASRITIEWLEVHGGGSGWWWTNDFLIWLDENCIKYVIALCTIELLSSWETLLKWSENAAEAKQLQEEMDELKVVLDTYGTKNILLESKASIESVSDILRVSEIQRLL